MAGYSRRSFLKLLSFLPLIPALAKEVFSKPAKIDVANEGGLTRESIEALHEELKFSDSIFIPNMKKTADDIDRELISLAQHCYNGRREGI